MSKRDKLARVIYDANQAYMVHRKMKNAPEPYEAQVDKSCYEWIADAVLRDIGHVPEPKDNSTPRHKAVEDFAAINQLLKEISK